MRIGRPIIAGGIVAALSVVLATPAFASTVTVVSASAPLTNATFSQTTATAGCPSGTTLVGGGVRLATTGGAAVGGDGSRITGTAPTDASGTPLANGATNPATWAGLGGFTAQANANDSVTSYAMCSVAVTSATEIAVTATANSLGPVTAVCPAGTSLVGGGALTGASSSLSDKTVGSYPSNAAGTVPVSGSTDPTGWTAVSQSTTATGVTTTAVALCATDVSVATQVATATATLPSAQGNASVSATATCPAGLPLLDGGANLATGGGPGTAGQGTHLIGDFPSDGSGVPAGTGAPSSWTASGQSGGQPVVIGAEAFALCDATAPPAQTPEFSRPALTVGGAALLVGVGVWARRRRLQHG